MEELFEGATCIICQEVLHRATSVQPCLHSFCSACLSGWLKRRGPALCPLCRKPVAAVTRNYTLSGLVEGLLKAHPDQQRADKELAELDAQDALQEAGYDLAKFLARGAAAADAGAAAAAAAPAPLLGGPAPAAAAGDASGSEASDSDEAEGSGDEAGPRCFHCGDAAWQTLGAAAGLLAGDVAEASGLALRALHGNDFEREMLEEWLRGHRGGRVGGMGGLGGALAAALADPNPEGAPPVQVRFPGAAVVAAPGAAAAAAAAPLPAGSWTDLLACRPCAVAVAHGVVYSLRERIPEGELPERARGRPRCWYGRHCRTQGHKPEHAQRLDHICEQTRFR
uniref:RING-type domain-containing protein n=2 Tax=Pyrodinium bahamense TaxID=73915 RepID=A0A7S0FBG8_9DINO